MNIEFEENGYITFSNKLTPEFLDTAREITLDYRNRTINENLIGHPRPFGLMKYWTGLDVASTEYDKLFEFYTSDLMYDIASELLDTDEIYLFNDQIVVKLPNDNFTFDPHSDNGYGPNPQMASEGWYRSITCCWVLDDFTDENGPVRLLNKKTGEYVTAYSKAGDIIVWDGETLHYSEENKSDKPRRVWLQVYTTQDITVLHSDFKNFYSQRFVKGNNLNQLKDGTSKTI